MTFQKAIALVAASLVGVLPAAFAGVVGGPIINPANGHIYYVLASEPWIDAEAEAVSLGGHLATIRDGAEQEWVKSTFRPLAGVADPRLWIGLNDAADEDLFVWASGEAVTFTEWAAGEPSNSGGVENYVVIRRASSGAPDGAWNDVSNGTDAYGVVEIVPKIAGRSGDTNVSLLFADFSSTSGLEFHGAATNIISSDGVVLRLVPAENALRGSAFRSDKVNAVSFSAFFTFRFSSAGGFGGGADGLAFVLTGGGQDIGVGGGGLGYFGLTNSVGVEFDIFNNSGNPQYNDSNGSHIAIDAGGLFDSGPGETLPILPSMKNGDRWFAWIDYDGSVLEARVNRAGIRPSLPTVTRVLTMTNELMGQMGKIGFTAGTGDGYANHDILSWQFNSSYAPIRALLPSVNVQLYPGVGGVHPRLSIGGSVGSIYQVQNADQLSKPNRWLPLATLVLTNNPTLWLDTTTPVASVRFYRVVPY